MIINLGYIIGAISAYFTLNVILSVMMASYLSDKNYNNDFKKYYMYIKDRVSKYGSNRETDVGLFDLHDNNINYNKRSNYKKFLLINNYNHLFSVKNNYILNNITAKEEDMKIFGRLSVYDIKNDASVKIYSIKLELID